MAGKVLDLHEILGSDVDQIARAIAMKYQEWEMYRNVWANGVKELRNYLFATSTATTTNSSLPWKNSTTIPKLTQIRDNLHANYMEALFPNEDWLMWEGNTLDDESVQKKTAIENYMKTKVRQDRGEIEVSKMLLDFIDCGNVFGTSVWVDESTTDAQGLVTRGFVGPRFQRISPFDIVFNPTVNNFAETPKIVRSLKTLGELYKAANKMPRDSVEYKLMKAALDKTTRIRQTVGLMNQGDILKSDGFQMDGFSSMQMYYQTDYVEVLTFYGDMYDLDSKELLENHVITVLDRAFLVDKRENPNWTVDGGIYHASWRQRPDNLYGMGPLDNLVGMQYRVDHLENMRADVFDLTAYPMPMITGYVEDFKYGPGERIYCGDEGKVEFLHPDTTVLNAETQIQELLDRMEIMAGAPKEAMGFRTPGEKTKFEVQVLDNAASRIFMNKIQHFETTFLEPLLNYSLQLARRNMSATDVVRTLDSEVDAIIFSTVSRDDITADGVLHPVGAREFAHRANQLQNLSQISNSHLYQDPAVIVHLSGKKLAQLTEDLMDLKKYAIFGDNIRIIEQGETQRLQAAMQENAQLQSATPPGIHEADQPQAGGPPVGNPAPTPGVPIAPQQ